MFQGANSSRVVITGDDFGLSAEVNRSVEAYHRAGVLDQASLMVTGPAVEDAVRVARRNPGLRVGLHLALCEVRPARSEELAEPTGFLPRSPTAAGLRFAFGIGVRSSLRAEIGAQFERFVALGFPPTYWDGHTHLHLHPVVLAETLPIATAKGFRRTRLVREPGPLSILPTVFHLLSAAAVGSLKRAGISFTDRTFGLRRTGRMTAAEFSRAFAHSRPGTTEVYFHPGAEPLLESPIELAAALNPLRSSPRASH